VGCRRGTRGQFSKTRNAAGRGGLRFANRELMAGNDGEDVCVFMLFVQTSRDEEELFKIKAAFYGIN
jgi:hypothetical protein